MNGAQEANRFTWQQGINRHLERIIELLEGREIEMKRLSYRDGIEAAKAVVLPRVRPKYLRDAAERELDALPDREETK